MDFDKFSHLLTVVASNHPLFKKDKTDNYDNCLFNEQHQGINYILYSDENRIICLITNLAKTS